MIHSYNPAYSDFYLGQICEFGAPIKFGRLNDRWITLTSLTPFWDLVSTSTIPVAACHW